MEQNEPNKEKLADKTPEEAKRTVKDKVARGVATVAGALEGFAEQAKKDDLPNTTKEAVKRAGETTRKTAETTREEGRKVKESIRGSSSRGTETPGSSPPTDRPTGDRTSFGTGSTHVPQGSMGGTSVPGASRPNIGEPSRPNVGESNRPTIGEPSRPGLGRTAARPDSPGVMRRSEGHGRSAAAELERQDEDEPDSTQAGPLDRKTRKTDKEADFERR